MDSEIVETITDWNQTQFSGGYQALRDLADAEFTGAVTQGTAWGFMLNGRLIGIAEGSLSTFESADGTAYESPTPALPLLYAMQESAEKQAEYYTNKKSIAEADDTLSSGSFTGYIELSENVLSGDYYTVYYGGKSMSVAFVGNSRTLLTDEEAFERADDEVGIYTVYAADLDIIELPEADQTADSASTPTDSRSSTATDSSSPQPSDATPPASSDADTTTDAAETPSTEASSDRPPEPTDAAGPTSEPTADGSSSESADSPQSGSSAARPEGGSEQSTASRPAHGGHTASSTEPPDERGSEPADTQSETVFSDEAEWRNTNTIPSLDPGDDGAKPKQATGTQSRQRSRSSNAQPASRRKLQKRLERAEEIMQKAEARHEQLLEERDAVEAERDEARRELERVKTKLSEAEAEIDRLESQLESGSTDGGGLSTGQTLSSEEALAGTSLLVRYDSKGDGTLADAISGDATQDDITANLRIEPRTTFEREGLVVDDQPFETFLEDRIEFAFVRWLAEEFLFEIQETGNQTALNGIYETLPAINRAELQGTVSLGTDEEGDELTATFDLVVRDKRDQPLFVADFTESKQPVSNGTINTLVRDGSEIVEQNESFAAAFAVTTSYYEGAALDAAADATGGGLLSASRGKSFVYVSRKRGFHLCLVERLAETFDLHVPEL